jgi:hypothetical protein
LVKINSIHHSMVIWLMFNSLLAKMLMIQNSNHLENQKNQNNQKSQLKNQHLKEIQLVKRVIKLLLIVHLIKKNHYSILKSINQNNYKMLENMVINSGWDLWHVIQYQCIKVKKIHGISFPDWQVIQIIRMLKKEIDY